MYTYIEGGKIVNPYTFHISDDYTDSVMTDMLYRADPNKYNELCMKYFGNTEKSWEGRIPQGVEAFLKEFLEDNSIVVCNMHPSPEYAPPWIINFKRV